MTVSKPAHPVPWLSDDEQRAWRAFMLATQLLLDQLDRELQRQAGMSHAYYGILVVLSEQPSQSTSVMGFALMAPSARGPTASIQARPPRPLHSRRT